MINNETVQQLFQNCRSCLDDSWQNNLFNQLPDTFCRGVTWSLGKKTSAAINCKRYLYVFEALKIIPKYCFQCYKIQVQPRTVIEFFKLMIIFDKLNLENDNLRKCTVESRTEIPGTYKGIIYSRNLKEAKKILKTIQSIISEEISVKIPVTLKRGCSEYSLIHPKFEKLDKNYKPAMRYKNEWQPIEDFADKNNLGAHLQSYHGSFNHPGFNRDDAKVMLTWLKYAATIGDLSYLKITELPIPKLQDLKRPPFQPADD